MRSVQFLDSAEYRRTVADAVLVDGRVQILFESLVEAGPAPDLEDATAIRINVTVSWRDGMRDRRVELSTVRM